MSLFYIFERESIDSKKKKAVNKIIAFALQKYKN